MWPSDHQLDHAAIILSGLKTTKNYEYYRDHGVGEEVQQEDKDNEKQED
jgi:hypothetical protein